MLNLSNFSVIPLLSLPKEHRAVWSRADVLKPCLDQGTRSLIRCGASTNKVVALAVSVDGLFDVDVDHGATDFLVAQELLHVEDVLRAVVFRGCLPVSKRGEGYLKESWVAEVFCYPLALVPEVVVQALLQHKEDSLRFLWEEVKGQFEARTADGLSGTTTLRGSDAAECKAPEVVFTKKGKKPVFYSRTEKGYSHFPLR